MKCIKCKQPSSHSIMVRHGVPPENPNNPRTPDTSGVHVICFCDFHWKEIKRVMGI